MRYKTLLCSLQSRLLPTTKPHYKPLLLDVVTHYKVLLRPLQSRSLPTTKLCYDPLQSRLLCTTKLCYIS
jgi:hypothetical protein